MKQLKAAIKSIYMTKWFFIASWKYIVTKTFASKVEFFKGIIPAWFRFTVAAYKDYEKVISNGK